MYKEIMYTLHKGEEPKIIEAEKTFSEEEVMAMLKSIIIDKASEYPELTSEQLEKGIGNAFKTGLTVLTLLHGVDQMSSSKEPESAPQELSANREKSSKPFSESSYGGRRVRDFLGTVGDLPTSTIKGMDSNTHDERLSSIIRRYNSMDDGEIDQHLEKFPKYRQHIEEHHANSMFREHGGDFKTMADAWNKKPEIEQKQPDNEFEQNNPEQYRDIASD